MLHTELDRRTFVIEFFTGESGSENGTEVGPFSLLSDAMRFTAVVKSLGHAPLISDVHFIARGWGVEDYTYVAMDETITFAEINAVSEGMTEDGFDCFQINLRR